MTLSHRITSSLAVSIVLCAAACVPALADVPLSVSLGAQFLTQGNAQKAGGDVQTDFGANYDVISAPVVPIQASLTFDASQGSNGNGMLNVLGFGLAGRLTTPLYAGAGLSVYNVNLRADTLNAPNTTSLGIGPSFFAGDRFLSLPGGVNFSLQATYKKVPQFDGVDPSSFGVGLRVQL
jgi:hypothetical protein